MKRQVKASELIDYEVVVNFGGYIGADETFSVEAEDEDDAIVKAEELARDELSVENIEEVDEDEYEVTIGYCGFVGVEEIYTVTADSEEEAEEAALEEAFCDLSGEIVED